MFRSSPFAKTLWLLAIALLLIRVGEAHLHLCLDGADRLVAFHVKDTPNHAGGKEVSGSHTDLDLAVSASALIKKLAVDELPPVAFAFFFIALIVPLMHGSWQPTSLVTPAFSTAHSRRPPPRGPPR
ncbi:hypothetical protein [Steroidobacter sp.]|uniref:hypothetical protein n=1 Tax=Steroidobacter sp. TaxID=1978227 RepID=UPI001A556988|nr:hypothetical protein [Steroidobacter sp.]MBL8268531.1 hypothetical protein [Steroidobacter sp.]